MRILIILKLILIICITFFIIWIVSHIKLLLYCVFVTGFCSPVTNVDSFFWAVVVVVFVLVLEFDALAKSGVADCTAANDTSFWNKIPRPEPDLIVTVLGVLNVFCA